MSVVLAPDRLGILALGCVDEHADIYGGSSENQRSFHDDSIATVCLVRGAARLGLRAGT
jgi:hypothetical protein